MIILFLTLSIVLSTCRNILSKHLSGIEFATRPFFLCQATLFLCGGITIILSGNVKWNSISTYTISCAIIYGLFLIFAQWFYTAALAKGNTALCSTVYSLGFIFPTLSGAIFWYEPFSFIDAVGVLCAIAVIITSGFHPEAEKNNAKSYHFIPLVIAMLSSGGLGIIQKLQQKSNYSYEKSIFLFFAFILAAGLSLLFASCSKSHGPAPFSKRNLITASCIGACFGCCNLLNTTLSGKLDSAIFFPTLNIGVIILSMLCGIIFFKEKISKRNAAILILSITSILLLNFG